MKNNSILDESNFIYKQVPTEILKFNMIYKVEVQKHTSEWSPSRPSDWEHFEEAYMLPDSELGTGERA